MADAGGVSDGGATEDDVARGAGGVAGDGMPVAAGEDGGRTDGGGEDGGWSVPEVASAAVLVALALVAIGGLAYGVVQQGAVSVPFSSGLTADQLGLVLVNSTSFAGVFYGLALLVVGGVAWWHGQAWIDDDEWSGGPAAAGGTMASVHARRAGRIAWWAVAGLVLNAVAAAVGLAGFALVAGPPRFALSQGLLRGAGLLAAVALLVAGAWSAGQLREMVGATGETAPGLERAVPSP